MGISTSNCHTALILTSIEPGGYLQIHWAPQSQLEFAKHQLSGIEEVPGGYIRFRYLYFRSEYRAMVSMLLSSAVYRHRGNQRRTFLDVFTEFDSVFDLILVGESFIFCVEKYGKPLRI